MSITTSSKIATTAITVMVAVTPALKPLSSVSTVYIIREIYVITIGVYVMCVYLHLLHKSYNIHHW